MHKYLPSKRFAYIILALLIALGIISLFSWLGKAKPTTKLSNLEVKSKVQEFMALDTDNDGMKDWEEALYKTDPKNPDTDGDGTSDGVEVNANRDPLKPNTAKVGAVPNDKIPDQVIAAQKKAVDDYNSLSDTDKVARMLFSQFLATKKVGQTLTEADMANIIQNTLTEMPTISFKQYSLADIKTTPGNDINAVKQYGNDIAKIIITDLLGEKIVSNDPDFYGFAQVSNYIILLDTAPTETQIKQATVAFDPIIVKYQILINNLLKVPAPNTLAKEHLTLINAFELISDNLSKFKNSNNNVIITAPLLQNYLSNIDNIFTTLTNTTKIFNDGHINFPTTDFGYLLFNVIMANK